MQHRRQVYSLALCCILSACLLTWWFTPVLALQTACDQIASVEVTNQLTGHSFTLRSQQTVSHITRNLSSHRVVRSHLAGAQDCSVYQLVFRDQSGQAREKLYLNHMGSLRRGSLFYYDSSSSLCFDYLTSLESALFGTAVPPGSVGDKPQPWELDRRAAYQPPH